MAKHNYLDSHEIVGMKIEFTNQSMIKVPDIKSETFDMNDDGTVRVLGFETLKGDAVLINLNNVNYLQISPDIK